MTDMTNAQPPVVSGDRENIARIVGWLDEAVDRAKRHGGTEGIWLFASQWRLIRSILALSTSKATTSDEVVPEGWRLVPVKLAEEMHEAVVNLDFTSTHDPLWPEYWSTLLAAAPTPPASDGMPQSAFEGGPIVTPGDVPLTPYADADATGAGESVEAMRAALERIARESGERVIVNIATAALPLTANQGGQS